jgi:uncharacterized protein (TIGR03083 family)
VTTSLTFEEHCAVLERSGRRLVELATAAGSSAKVPTCPAWRVDQLVAHLATVHRWATAHITGSDPAAVPTQTALRAQVTDLVGYYREGLDTLLAALRGAPEDLRAMTFLAAAPAPRTFWARRQAHETTIHMVDAIGARLGRFPTGADVELDAEVAVDGVDELLRGFFTRGRSKVFAGSDEVLLVRATDVDARWVVHLSDRLTVEPGRGTPPRTPTTVVSGSACAIYLTLWNRADDATVEGDEGLLERWRAKQRVRWS